MRQPGGLPRRLTNSKVSQCNLSRGDRSPSSGIGPGYIQKPVEKKVGYTETLLFYKFYI